MKPYAQRIAIALSCGWRLSAPDSTGIVWGQCPETANGQSQPIPNYPDDLNACHKMEDELNADQCSEYVRKLDKSHESTTLFVKEFTSNDDDLAYEVFGLIHATAAQRCEAFLRVVGKWTEETK